MAKKSAKKAAAARAAEAERPNRKAGARGKAKKYEGGELFATVWHKGKVYGPGDEAAFDKLKLKDDTLQSLANKRKLSGFGTQEPPEEDEEVEEESGNEGGEE